MKYVRPEVLSMAVAVVAVESTSKGINPVLDNPNPMTFSNPPAYEADE